MNFLNPQETFKRLKEFPYVLYHALTCGDWNTVIITNKLLDLSQSVGFQSMVYRDTKYGSYTPKVDYTTWDTCFTTINEAITHSTPPKCKSKNRSLSPALTWEKDQWKLFCAFKDNIRKKITPTLRGIGVRYKTYAEWFKSLQDHCTVCTGFYPHRYQTYLHWLFLLDSQYEESVTSLFRLVPATPVITEVGETLLLRIGVTTPHITRTLICALLDLHTKTVITHSRKAFILSEYIHPYTIL